MDYRELLVKYMKFQIANAACGCSYCKRDYAAKQVFNTEDFVEMDKIEKEVKAILLVDLDSRGSTKARNVSLN